MYMSDILFWALIIAAAMAVFVCYWLTATALFPGVVSRAEQRYAKPVRTTLIGIAAAVPFVFLAIALGQTKHPLGQMLGFVAVGVPIILGLMGSAGVAKRIGTGLNSPVDEVQPWKAVLRGGIVFTFLMLLPFIGWFVVLPWALFSGVGAFVLSALALRKERRQARKANAPMAQASSPEGDTPDAPPALASGN